MRRNTPERSRGTAPRTTRRRSISHSPSTGAKFPRRGGFVAFRAQAGGAESEARSADDVDVEGTDVDVEGGALGATARAERGRRGIRRDDDDDDDDAAIHRGPPSPA